MKTNTLLIVLLIVGLIVAVYFFTKKDEERNSGGVVPYNGGNGSTGGAHGVMDIIEHGTDTASGLLGLFDKVKDTFGIGGSKNKSSNNSNSTNRYECVNNECGEALTESELNNGYCPYCGSPVRRITASFAGTDNTIQIW